MLNTVALVVVGLSQVEFALSIHHLEIRVDHASVKVSDKLRLKAIQMKAKAEGMTLDQFCSALSRETRDFYRQKLFPTKLGPEKAYRDESGAWRMHELETGSQPYTLQKVLEANLYTHIREYLMGLILSDTGQRRKGYEPETIILRDDNKVAVVKRGKLELHSSDDWFKTLEKKKGKRSRAAESQKANRTQ